MQYAFKCRACGHLEEPGNAGENEVPAACRNCGAGVAFDPRTGIKKLVPENWIVLADLEGDELDAVLEQHAISQDDIVRHEPEPKAETDREPTSISREVAETVGLEDHAE